MNVASRYRFCAVLATAAGDTLTPDARINARDAVRLPGEAGMMSEHNGFHQRIPALRASEVTRLLGDWQAGNDSARDELVAAIYPELRRMANRQLSGMTQITLQPTALVHEVWLKLSAGATPNCGSRAHFMSLAARVMRQIAIDHARRRTASKRDGGIRVTLDEQVHGDTQRELDVLALDDALQRLAAVEIDKARIVEMHYFGGMSSDEIAEVMGCSAITVKRGWRTARAWLREQLE